MSSNKEIVHVQDCLCNCNILKSQSCILNGFAASMPYYFTSFKLKFMTNSQLSKIINKSRLMSHATLHNNLQYLSHHYFFCCYLSYFQLTFRIQHEKSDILVRVTKNLAIRGLISGSGIKYIIFLKVF